MSGRRVLVIEDNTLNLKLVRDILQFAGHQVSEARSGEDGLRLAQQDPPDLVLMDLQLPGIDGFETLHRLRQGILRPGVPVVAVTALAMAEDRERAAQAGFDGYLEKPISVRALPGQIEEFLAAAPAATDEAAAVTILAVDDAPANLRLLEAVLTPHGYRIVTAASGAEALDILSRENIDLVLLDVVMPEMDGHEVCRRIRAVPSTEFLPVVMITASGGEQRLTALESGADDFVSKPFDQSELLARVASLARIKRFQDTIRRQADELAEWNRELEARVARQVADLERTNRLRRFLSPQLVDLVVGDESLLSSHRREVVVLFTDLRKFTPFAETSEPEEVMGVLAEYHRVIGSLVHAYGGTLERFTGDGIMVFFNDPVPCEDPAERAVRTALGIRDEVRELAVRWERNGYDLALGIGIAQGFATLGRIGFEGRFDYAAIGSVTNLAARLCGDAGPWQVLVTNRVLAPIAEICTSELFGDVQPKGFSRSVRVHHVNGIAPPPEPDKKDW
ncbi:response regulator [Mycobacterium hackensackense]|uniref:response regulator n=1 Tax=Mycobacterium hackensackense TaxID=228909 RepID=UPI002265B188|nr:response regulator [Mycobacterium hackensackense]